MTCRGDLRSPLSGGHHARKSNAADGELPAYGNELILMLKGSALASTITLLDLTGVARTLIARTYLAVELFAVAGLIYLLLTLLIVRGVRLLERRWTVPHQRLETVPATRHGDPLS